MQDKLSEKGRPSTRRELLEWLIALSRRIGVYNWNPRGKHPHTNYLPTEENIGR